jgi:hypothetical protein
MDVISSKLDDLNDMLLKPTPYDQGPGRIIPYSIPVWFGPLPLTTAGRPGEIIDQTGHETLADLADVSAFVTPKDGDILIDQSFTFHVKSMLAYGFVNWGYTAQPSFAVPTTIVNAGGVGDILDNTNMFGGFNVSWSRRRNRSTRCSP